ncbi:MAG TPA: MarR family transcriptional regulator [Pirellulales bacterium]|jgi:DNA-binding MarR family transcriptional regulator|nr:MarR family transcriptional regulator [Pirellulales bacterium]
MSKPGDEPADKTRRFDSLEQEAFLNLWRTYDRLHLAEEELFSRYDLTPQQYNALRLLRGEGDRKLATLALGSRLVSRAPDITRLLDKLEERGLIERQRPADNRRIVLIGLTALGLALLAELDEPVRSCHEKQLGHLSKDQLRQLTALLQVARRPHEDASSHWLPPL